MRYLEARGSDVDISKYMLSNLSAGVRLAGKNEVAVLDEKTTHTYELCLIRLEQFAKQENDPAVLFGSNKRPFLPATIKTFMRKYIN